VENVLIPKSSVIICRTVSLFIFNSSAIYLAPNLLSRRAKVRTLSTFESVLCIFGCPLLGSCWTSSYPFFSHLCHSKTLDFFTAYSPYATVNRANVSLALLPSFTLNLMFICCSRFSSLIFPPAVYHRHVLLPLLLGNERLIWCVAHVNAS
jgi:hypothetical protein